MTTFKSRTYIFFLVFLFTFSISTDALRNTLLAKCPRRVVVNWMVTVDPRLGKGNFTTISAALAAAPTILFSRNGYFVISIARGVYSEYINVTSNQMNIMMIGAGIGKTIITGNRSVADGSSTYNSATVVVDGQGFVAKKITFRNTAGAAKQQAVAVRNSAERSAFYRCSFEGYQATLYAHSMTQFYTQCDIYGTVDIIFGYATAVFQSCNIYPRVPLPGQYNTITAHGRSDPAQDTGFSFQWCNINARALGSVTTFLGRPWGVYSRTVFMQSCMGPVISAAGWAPFSGNAELSKLYYAEFNNTGPGSVISNRVTWPGFHVMNATAAQSFTVAKFISGDQWLLAIGVPFTAGLKR